MTRFARAKGSKSSNEKAPEDSTPWEVMKEQLIQSKKEGEEQKKRQEAEKQRIDNYENFLKEQKIAKRKATWCDFPGSESNNNTSKGSTKPSKKVKKNKVIENQNQTKDRKQSEENEPKGDIDNFSSNKKKKKSNNKKQSEENEANGDVGYISPNKKKDKMHSKNKNKPIQETQDKPDKGSEIDDNIKNSNTKQPNPNQLGKSKKNKKNKKFVDGVPQRRKPIDDKSFQLIINGKEVELVRFDGFPVMKKDAERLSELKSNMMKKGIPKSEVQRTMKLERRRAEKALARVKRDVCYNCRKGGHNLSDCPELKSKIPGVDAAEGVCFKCGSTEHRQFECKVQRDKEFRFATCFICKEPGHIARQCPDNPKGLYPNGGSCKLCGDVTHLRKDCPTTKETKEGSSIKLNTLDGDLNIEEIAHPSNTQQNTEVSKKPKKIKF